MNHCIYSGHLTAAIETRQAGEHTVQKFTVAVNQGERVAFIPTESWDMPHLEDHLEKGSKVLVRGAVRQDRWETDEGEKRSRLYVTAHEVEFLDPPPARSSGRGAKGDSARSSVSRTSSRRAGSARSR